MNMEFVASPLTLEMQAISIFLIFCTSHITSFRQETYCTFTVPGTEGTQALLLQNKQMNKTSPL